MPRDLPARLPRCWQHRCLALKRNSRAAYCLHSDMRVVTSSIRGMSGICRRLLLMLLHDLQSQQDAKRRAQDSTSLTEDDSTRHVPKEGGEAVARVAHSTSHNGSRALGVPP